MDESDKAPLTPPQPEPENSLGSNMAQDAPQSARQDSEQCLDLEQRVTPDAFPEPISDAISDPLHEALLPAPSAAPPAEIFFPQRQRAQRPRVVLLIMGLALMAFAIWMAGSRAGWFGTGDPLETARAQLQDLDQQRWRAAYDLFSPRYRQEVPFDTWRGMALLHSRMFRTREMRFAGDRQWSGGEILEAHLVTDSGDRYLARFTLIYAQGHWWVDDLHWGREPETPGQVTA